MASLGYGGAIQRALQDTQAIFRNMGEREAAREKARGERAISMSELGLRKEQAALDRARFEEAVRERTIAEKEAAEARRHRQEEARRNQEQRIKELELAQKRYESAKSLDEQTKALREIQKLKAEYEKAELERKSQLITGLEYIDESVDKIRDPEIREYARNKLMDALGDNVYIQLPRGTYEKAAQQLFENAFKKNPELTRQTILKDLDSRLREINKLQESGEFVDPALIESLNREYGNLGYDIVGKQAVNEVGDTTTRYFRQYRGPEETPQENIARDVIGALNTIPSFANRTQPERIKIYNMALMNIREKNMPIGDAIQGALDWAETPALRDTSPLMFKSTITGESVPEKEKEIEAAPPKYGILGAATDYAGRVPQELSTATRELSGKIGRNIIRPVIGEAAMNLLNKAERSLYDIPYNKAIQDIGQTAKALSYYAKNKERLDNTFLARSEEDIARIPSNSYVIDVNTDTEYWKDPYGNITEIGKTKHPATLYKNEPQR